MSVRLRDDAEHLTVVDAAPELLQKIEDFPDVTKVCSLFEDFVPDGKYDTIVMEHILEHLIDPVGLMRRAIDWLAPEGVMVIGVPNAFSLHRMAAVEMGLLGDCHELNDRDRALGHRRVYDMEALVADVTAAGLEVTTRQGVFLKPLSNGQIEQHWSDEMVEAFYKLGHRFPEYAAELSLIARPAG
jgi:2-polyprenyl-3-methyl-5-hydroxy-6-metoxy-1,4-benzoquinol methylase